MTKLYKSYRIIDGKPRWIIVDENGNIVNKNPTKEELKGLEKFHQKDGRRCRSRPGARYTHEELLECLIGFVKENGRVPVASDFNNNPEYPNFATYQIHFGSWNKALEIGLNIKREKYASEKYTNEELLNYLRLFEKDNGRPPIVEDFINNPKYPSFATYRIRFGSWINSLKLAGLDVDLMGRQGNSYRGRQAEITIINHFKNKPTDLSGENYHSPCDGICPNGVTYDVKSSKLNGGKYYQFGIRNKYKDKIQIYYLLAFNEDYTKLIYVWRIPALIVARKDTFYVGLSSSYEFNVENMKEYKITDKIKDILKDIIIKE